MNLQDKALVYAAKKHGDQLDDADRPYFFAHIVQVHSVLTDVTDDEETLCAGILHDTMEDQGVSFDELAQEFTPNIAKLVYALTDEKDETGRKFFPRLTREYLGDHLYKKAVLAKFADRISNVSRLDVWSQKRQMKYLEKRSKFWETE